MGGRRDRGARRYIALLRGINVGGKNPLPMRALVEMFQTARNWNTVQRLIALSEEQA